MNQQKESKPHPYEQLIIKELERAFPAVKYDWLPIMRLIKDRLCTDCIFKKGTE